MRLPLLVTWVVVPALLPGQAPDSLPFRAGQWGAEFTLTGAFGGAGLLRFATPKRAWVVDASGSYSTNSSPRNFDQASTQFRVGARWYRSARPRILQHVTAGLEGGTNDAREHRSLDSLRTVTLSTQALSLGAFTELGAGWLVTEHLALGATWSVSARYQRTHGESLQGIVGPSDGPDYRVARDRRQGWAAAFGQLAIRATLYF